MSTQPVIYTYQEYTGYGRLPSTKIDWDRTYATTPECKYWERQARTLCELLEKRMGSADYVQFINAIPEPKTWMEATLILRAALDLVIREHLTGADLVTRSAQAVCAHAHVETDETGSVRMMAGDVDDNRRTITICADCGKVMDEPKPVDDELEF
jgi:hypothetical protein